MIVSWMIGERNPETANLFIDDLQSRLANRVQLTTDGLKLYLDAVAGGFAGNVDYAMLVKLYGEDANKVGPEKKYSPGVCTGAKRRAVTGNPNADHISTSHVERHNLTMRMSMKRFARLSNAFSKKIDNHVHALSLYFVWFNLCRIHKSVRMSPAMAAGLTDKLMSLEDVAALVDARAPVPGKRGPYKKRIAKAAL